MSDQISNGINLLKRLSNLQNIASVMEVYPTELVDWSWISDNLSLPRYFLEYFANFEYKCNVASVSVGGIDWYMILGLDKHLINCWVICCPILGVISQGSSEHGALEAIKEAIKMVMEDDSWKDHPALAERNKE